MAFSRPAFATELAREESGPGLSDALKDTETALNTGQLKDRETSGILRVGPGGIGLIGNSKWQAQMQEVLRLVKEARAAYKHARDNQKLIEYPKQISILDWSVAQNLDKLRGDAIRILNRVLKDADLPEVVSSL
jgi:hypothetical protein